MHAKVTVVFATPTTLACVPPPLPSSEGISPRRACAHPLVRTLSKASRAVIARAHAPSRVLHVQSVPPDHARKNRGGFRDADHARRVLPPLPGVRATRPRTPRAVVVVGTRCRHAAPGVRAGYAGRRWVSLFLTGCARRLFDLRHLYSSSSFWVLIASCALGSPYLARAHAHAHAHAMPFKKYLEPGDIYLPYSPGSPLFFFLLFVAVAVCSRHGRSA